MKQPLLPHTIRGLFFYTLRQYPFWFSLLALAMLASASAHVLTSYALKLLVDNATQGQALWSFGLAYIGIITLDAAGWRLYEWAHYHVFPLMKTHFGIRFFTHIMDHSHRYFANHLSGTLVAKVMDIRHGIEHLMEMFFQSILYQIILIAAGSIVVGLSHPIFCVCFLVWTAVFLSGTVLLLKKPLLASRAFAEKRSLVSGFLADTIGNINSVRLFAHVDSEKQHLTTEMDELAIKDRDSEKAVFLVRLVQDITIILFYAAIIFSLIHLYKQGKITAGDFAVVLALSRTLMSHVWAMAAKFNQMARNMGVCRQALATIFISHDILDDPQAKDLVVTKGEITFNNVNFAYEGQSPLFCQKNITLNPGEKVGLVGYSGSGKSSFVNLILRYFDLDDGAISIDGQNISKITQQSLRGQIAMIPQDTALFSRTILDNIRYANPNATTQMIEAAAKKAHAHEFIMDLPNGYNSLVGERGVKLSGGQRQRIAIARAILKNAPIFILDEATSALDSDTEKHIKDSLQTMMANRTSIVIAHRLSTLTDMDRILVFDKGRIIQDGSHEILMADKTGHYARLWDLQAKGFLDRDL